MSETPNSENEESAEMTESLATMASPSSNYKTRGKQDAQDGTGVLGYNTATTGTAHGVEGFVDSPQPQAAGVYGEVTSTSNSGRGVKGVSQGSSGVGVAGRAPNGGTGVLANAGSGGNALIANAPVIINDTLKTNTVDTRGNDFSVLAGTTSTNDAGNVVLGHSSNEVTSTDAVGATISGGGFDDGTTSRPNTVSDNYGTVGGGWRNEAGDGGADATTAEFATVAGGDNNTASGQHSFVGGGFANEAKAEFATIAGGGPSDEFSPSSTKNIVHDEYGTIAGGGNNTAGASGSTTASYATVGGGSFNTASGDSSTIGGGGGNIASDRHATVGGGNNNAASGQTSTIAGGSNNVAGGWRSTIAGGNYNRATAKVATVGGGRYNEAKAEQATIPGGNENRATGIASFAAGEYAWSDDDNAFVWNDGSGTFDDGFSSSDSDGTSGVTGARTFHIRASGGIRIITDTGTSNVTYISGGSAGWSSTSTRTAKTNIDPIEPEVVLDGLESLEVATWEYADEDGEGQGERHIGPMAEEFHEAFDVGDTDTAINSINADGVAFAAIQGLSERLEQKDERIDAQRERIDELEAENEQLRERLATIESNLGLDTATTDTPADD